MRYNSAWPEYADRPARGRRAASQSLRGSSDLREWFPGRPQTQGMPLRVADTYIISNNNRPKGIPWLGMHTGLAILSDDGDPEKNALYDPNGSYPAKDIGEGRLLLGGPDISLKDYEAYQLQDGPNVTVRRYDTTSEQEKQIMKRMDENGGGGNFSCTRDVSKAVAGIGPFEKVESTFLPSAFDRHLEAHPTYVQKYRPGEQSSGPANGSLKKIILDSLQQQIPAKYRRR